MVKVPAYRAGMFASIRSMMDRALYSTRLETVAGCVTGALMVVCALFVPRVYGPLALAILGGLAMVYPRRIERAWLGDGEIEESVPPGWLARSLRRVGRYVIGLALAAGFVAPLWFGQMGPTLLPRRTVIEGTLVWGVAMTLWILLPIVTYLFVVSDEGGRLGPKRALEALVRRPGATAAALLSFPVAMIALECLIVLFLWLVDWFQLWTFDLFPFPTGFERRARSVILPESLAQEYGRAAWLIYAHGLGHGSTMLAANPLSLHHGAQTQVSISAYGPSRVLGLTSFQDWTYLFARFVLSMVILSTGMIMLAAQSFWLGRIGSSPIGQGEKKAAVAV